MPKNLFQNGNPGKPIGAVNKVQQKVRESIVNFLGKNIDTIQKDFDSLKPRERLAFVESILIYAVPKLQHIQSDVRGEIGQEIRVTWEMPNLSLNELQTRPNESSLGNENGNRSGLSNHS